MLFTDIRPKLLHMKFQNEDLLVENINLGASRL